LPDFAGRSKGFPNIKVRLVLLTLEFLLVVRIRKVFGLFYLKTNSTFSCSIDITFNDTPPNIDPVKIEKNY
jgi:hypothetical protein